MKRKLLIVTFFLSLLSSYTIAQSATAHFLASLSNMGQYIEPWLQSYHKRNYSQQLTNFGKDFHLLIKFKVDTTGSIIDINILSSDSLPKEIKTYAQQLLKSTNGWWHPAIEAGKSVVSEIFTCNVYLRNKSIKSEERSKLEEQSFHDEFEKLFEGKMKEAVFLNADDYNPNLYSVVSLEI